MISLHRLVETMSRLTRHSGHYLPADDNLRFKICFLVQSAGPPRRWILVYPSPPSSPRLQHMPPRSRLKKLLSSIRDKKSSNAIDNGAPTSNAAEEHPLVPVVHDTLQTGPSPLEVDDRQSNETEIHADRKNLGSEDPFTRLMVVDAAIEIVAIMKEASEASSVLTPLKSVCGIIIRVLEIARVSYELCRLGQR